MNSPILQLCQRVVMVLGVIAVATAMMLGQSVNFVLGIAAGVALGLLNLIALRRIGTRFVRAIENDGKTGGLVASLLLVKVTAAIAAVWIIIYVLHIDPIGFGLGLTLVVSAMIFVPLLATSQVSEVDRLKAIEATTPSTPSKDAEER